MGYRKKNPFQLTYCMMGAKLMVMNTLDQSIGRLKRNLAASILRLEHQCNLDRNIRFLHHHTLYQFQQSNIPHFFQVKN